MVKPQFSFPFHSCNARICGCTCTDVCDWIGVFTLPLPRSPPINMRIYILSWWCRMLFQPSPGNYTTAGEGETARPPQYRGLFIRTSPRQHTDYISDWDLKKPFFYSSLLVLSLPTGLDLLLFPHLSSHQHTAHLMGLPIGLPVWIGRNRAISPEVLHLLPPRSIGFTFQEKCVYIDRHQLFLI